MASNGGAFRSPRIQVVSAFVVGPARSFRKGGVPPEFWLMRNPDLVGGWTNPFEKYARQIGNLPQVGVKIKNIWNHHLGNPDVFLNKKQGRTSINPTCWCGKSWYFGRPFVCLHSVFKGGKKDPTNNRTKQSHTGCASWWPKACFSAELGWILGWKSALERPLVPQKQITDPISFTKFYGKKKGGEVIKWSNKKLRFNEIYKKVATLLLIFSPKYLGFLKLQFFQSSPASFIDCLFLWFANHVSCIKGTSKWKAHHLKVDRKRITNTQYIINIYIYVYILLHSLQKKAANENKLKNSPDFHKNCFTNLETNTENREYNWMPIYADQVLSRDNPARLRRCHHWKATL